MPIPIQLLAVWFQLASLLIELVPFNENVLAVMLLSFLVFMFPHYQPHFFLDWSVKHSREVVI